MGGRFQNIFITHPRLPATQLREDTISWRGGSRPYRSTNIGPAKPQNKEKTNLDPIKQKMNGNTASISSQPTSSPMKQGIPCNETCRKCFRLCSTGSWGRERNEQPEEPWSSQESLGAVRTWIRQEQPEATGHNYYTRAATSSQERSHEARSNQKQPDGQEKPGAATTSQEQPGAAMRSQEQRKQPREKTNQE